MIKVIFQISYEILPEKRDEYLSTVKQLQDHLVNESGKNYTVFEDKNKKNYFSEMYLCSSEEEYENLENDTDDMTFDLTNKIFNNYIIDKKANYSTFYSVE
jgi:hypothetical protein